MNVYDTRPEMKGQISRGTQPYTLNATDTNKIVVHLWLDSQEVHKLGAGVVQITDYGQALFTYWWHVDDTNMPGLWAVWCELFINGAKATTTLKVPLQINDWVGVSSYARRASGRLNVA